MDAQGEKLGEPTRITESSGASNLSYLSWTGEEYGLVWIDQRDGDREVYFTRIDAGGTKIAGDLRITASTAPTRL